MTKGVKEKDNQKTIILPSFLLLIVLGVIMLLFGQLLGVILKPRIGNNEINSFASRKEAPNESTPYYEEELPVTGEVNEWSTYKDGHFGYSFSIPPDISVLKDESCSACSSKKDSKLQIGSFEVHTYSSESQMDLDFDLGLDKERYLIPRRILIDEIPYFEIINKDGGLEMIAKEFKYVGDMLWVKNEHKVSNLNNSYYISFNKALEAEPDLNKWEAIFSSFEF